MKILWVTLAVLLFPNLGFVEAQEEAPSVVVRLALSESQAEALPVVLEWIGGSEQEVLHRIDTTAPGRVRIPLAGEPPWTLRASADGFWSQPLSWASPPEESPRLRLFPAAAVTGLIRVPEGSELPPGIALRLQSSGVSSDLQATLLCPITDQGAFSCAVPAMPRLDLRLRATGFASRYFWDLDLTRDQGRGLGIALGTLRLHPGASLVGFIEVPAGFDITQTQVELQPTRGTRQGVDGEEARVRDQVRATEAVDEKGFFSLEGLSAGSYRLRVTHPSLASQEIDPVRLVEGGQTTLDDVLRLQPPAPIRLVLDPPFDPYDAPWQVSLYRRLPSGQATPVAQAQSVEVEAGTVEVSVAPGPYEVRIFDSRGARLMTAEVMADGSRVPEVLVIEPILVEGLVTLGDEPVLARITFRSESSWTFDADVEGRFRGYLPREGDWDVAIEAFEPPVERRTRALPVKVEDGEERASLKLRLPNTTLEGMVVDETGTGVEAADVTLSDPLFIGREVTVTSDADGRFEVRALDEGATQAQAVLQTEVGEVWSSQPEVVELVEDENVEVRLVMRPHKELRGRIVANDGNPVPGSWIEVSPFDRAGLLDTPAAQPHTADAAGRFAISLPAAVETVHLSVMPPGHPLVQRVVAVEDVGDLRLPAESGSLIIRFPDRVDTIPWSDPSSPRPGLVRSRGVKFFLGALSRWSGMNGQPWDLGSFEVTLPLLEPGRYAVCWMSPRDWLIRDASGTGCVEALVPAGGSATLRLQAPNAPIE